MIEIDKKTAIFGAIATGAAYLLYKKAGAAADIVGVPVGNALASIQQFFNGNHAVESTQAGIPLTDLGLTFSGGQYHMSQSKRDSLAVMHPDNGRILSAVLTSTNIVKAQYVPYVNVKIVTLDDI